MQVIDGLDWVKANHQPSAVAVMALGGDAQSALDLAVHNLVLSGVNVMVAAGNEDTDACTKSPARCVSSEYRHHGIPMEFAALPHLMMPDGAAHQSLIITGAHIALVDVMPEDA